MYIWLKIFEHNKTTFCDAEAQGEPAQQSSYLTGSFIVLILHELTVIASYHHLNY
ncbi:hypothetical protein R50072_36110 [Simiduia litorea]